MPDIGNLHFASNVLRGITQNAKDLRSHLADDSVDTAAVAGLLDSIEKKASLGLGSVEAVAQHLRRLAG